MEQSRIKTSPKPTFYFHAIANSRVKAEHFPGEALTNVIPSEQLWRPKQADNQVRVGGAHGRGANINWPGAEGTRHTKVALW